MQNSEIKKGNHPNPSTYGRNHYVRYGTFDQHGVEVEIERKIYDPITRRCMRTDIETITCYEPFERDGSLHSVILTDGNIVDVVECNKDDNPDNFPP